MIEVDNANDLEQLLNALRQTNEGDSVKLQAFCAYFPEGDFKSSKIAYVNGIFSIQNDGVDENNKISYWTASNDDGFSYSIRALNKDNWSPQHRKGCMDTPVTVENYNLRGHYLRAIDSDDTSLHRFEIHPYFE